MLEDKGCLLRGQKLEKNPNKTNSLTKQEEDILWECGQLGNETPKSVILALWW